MTALVGIFSVSGSLRASKTIHTLIMKNLFRAPLSYYEAQPIGRILNRLSSDLDAMDCNLMNAVDGLFNAGGQIIASTIMVTVTVPLALVMLLPISWIAYRIQALYRV
jgi:ABC-type multidrug transport system fused ATPase/permease subunit